MASLVLHPLQSSIITPSKQSSASAAAAAAAAASSRISRWSSPLISFSSSHRRSPGNKRKSLTVVAAAVELSSDSTTYLIAGAVAIALLGTAFPILFSRKDTCPECDGAGFIRQGTAVLRANAARKDQVQIVCKRCNGLGKLNQIDK
ncbi:hypothetical protein Dimus_007382 [Dionaea muscipula]